MNANTVAKELRRRFDSTKCRKLFLDMKKGASLTIEKLPTYGLSNERYAIATLDGDWVIFGSNAKYSFYNEASSLYEAANILINYYNTH